MTDKGHFLSSVIMRLAARRIKPAVVLFGLYVMRDFCGVRDGGEPSFFGVYASLRSSQHRRRAQRRRLHAVAVSRTGSTSGLPIKGEYIAPRPALRVARAERIRSRMRVNGLTAGASPSRVTTMAFMFDMI